MVAGTTATVTVELLSHVIDTINMKSKIIDQKKNAYTKKQSTFSKYIDKENMRGYQMVIYGYIFSSMVFFFVQTKSKYLIDHLEVEKPEIEKLSNVILEDGKLLKYNIEIAANPN